MGYTILFREITHRINLVLHQRNQRRYYYRNAIHQQRWQLVTQTLTASCRHQYKSVLAVNNVVNDCFLIPLKRIETKMMLQSSD